MSPVLSNTLFWLLDSRTGAQNPFVASHKQKGALCSATKPQESWEHSDMKMQTTPGASAKRMLCPPVATMGWEILTKDRSRTHHKRLILPSSLNNLYEFLFFVFFCFFSRKSIVRCARLQSKWQIAKAVVSLLVRGHVCNWSPASPVYLLAASLREVDLAGLCIFVVRLQCTTWMNQRPRGPERRNCYARSAARLQRILSNGFSSPMLQTPHVSIQ